VLVFLCMNMRRGVKLMNKIYVGKTTMTHGIKGELKFYTDFSRKDLILKKDFPIFIAGGIHFISSVRPHKNYYLITIDGFHDINLVEEFRNQSIYVSLSDLHLPDEEILFELLSGYLVFENGNLLGKVLNVLYNKSGVLLEVQGDSKFFIPYQEAFIEGVLKNEQKILVKNVKGFLL